MSDKLIMTIKSEQANSIYLGLQLSVPQKTAPLQPAPFLIYLCETNDNLNGKITGCFTCNWIKYNLTFCKKGLKDEKIKIAKRTHMLLPDLEKYANGEMICEYLVSEPKIFEKPIPLDQFGIAHPPQNWCYIIEKGENNV